MSPILFQKSTIYLDRIQRPNENSVLQPKFKPVDDLLEPLDIFCLEYKLVRDDFLIKYYNLNIEGFKGYTLLFSQLDR